MAYRYVFHLLNAVTDMYESRKARTAKRDADVARGRAFVSASAGALFGKAHALSEEVHLAMVSRGYTGNARSIGAGRLRAIDAAWIAGALVLALAVIGADRALVR
jgi:energy-coupling factor transporter transmembrane protein EcfT